MDYFNLMGIKERLGKPRSEGLTMVIDKNLGINGVKDLVDTAGDHIDIVKLGWATWTVMPPRLVKDKIESYTDDKICVAPGGTSLEVAVLLGKVDKFFSLIRWYGFTGIEVSDGSIDLSPEKRKSLIHKAKNLGFRVYSEVGKKNPKEDGLISDDERIRRILNDLKYGAEKVIIEARESGKNLGVYDKDGNVNPSLVKKIEVSVGLEKIIFEAPNKNQQVWFIDRYGPYVNLGNIATTDVIALETLRRGLRGDTFSRFWR